MSKRKRKKSTKRRKNKKQKIETITKEIVKSEYKITSGNWANFIPRLGVYQFNKLDNIGLILDPKEKAMIISSEKPNGGRVFWVTPSLQTIHNLIKNGNCYLHEVLHLLPTKMFLDIDCSSSSQNLLESRHRDIESFKETYLRKLKNYFNKKDVIGGEWVLLDSCNDKKISYHLIGNHTCNGKPIYFMDVDHVVKMVKRVLGVMKQSLNFAKCVDLKFYPKKSIRMYYCSKRDDPNRRLWLKPNTPYDPKLMKRCLLQNYVPSLPYYQIEFRGFCSRRKNYKNSKLAPKKIINGCKGSEEFTKLFLEFLKRRGRIQCEKSQRYFGFGFLNPSHFYSVKTTYYGNSGIWINLINTWRECHIQKDIHNCPSGRVIVLLQNYKVKLWCAGNGNAKMQRHFKEFHITLPPGEEELRALYKEICIKFTS